MQTERILLMTSVDKFLNGEWEIDEEVEGVDLWKHIHEFTHRYDCLVTDCQGDHSRSISILQSMGYQNDEIDEVLEWFKENGGYCDCEVGMNILMCFAKPDKKEI